MMLVVHSMVLVVLGRILSDSAAEKLRRRVTVALPRVPSGSLGFYKLSLFFLGLRCFSYVFVVF